MGDIDIQLPYKFVERDYQRGLVRAVMDDGMDRAVHVWHRRAGKEKTDLNIMVTRMFGRVGSYFYLFPTYKQGRQILWDGIDGGGFRFMDHIPRKLRKRTDKTNMVVEAKNGSIFRVIGTDDIDRVVGTNPVGLVFSEYSLQDPAAWDYLRPVLAENKGWAIFNFTPRGKNHAYELFQMARRDPKWYCELLTVEDTGAISEEVLKREREEIIAQYGDDALFQQEYYCSFEVPIQGAYYATQIQRAYDEGRIRNVPWDATIPVHTYWDLGVGDATAIWFVQFAGEDIRMIDYYEASGEGLQHYISVLSEKEYVYRDHFAPHDIEVRELGTGKSRKEIAAKLGIRFRVAPKLSLDDGIQAVRTIFNRCYFDEGRCRRGLEALKQYHKEYDEKSKTYKSRPKHDWSSHGADAFRTLGVTHRDKIVTRQIEEKIGRRNVKTDKKGYINPLTGW